MDEKDTGWREVTPFQRIRSIPMSPALTLEEMCFGIRWLCAELPKNVRLTWKIENDIGTVKLHAMTNPRG